MRLQSLLLGFALALAAALTPPAAQAGQITNQNYACGKGSFLIGFQGHIGVWIDQFQPVCATWEPARQRLGSPTPGPIFGDTHGGGVTLVQALCKPGHVVSGISYGLAKPNGPPGHVQDLAVSCRDVNSLERDESDKPVMGKVHPPITIGGLGVVVYPGIDCTQGLVANNLVIGLDGINVAALNLGCDTPENVMAAAPGAKKPKFDHKLTEAAASKKKAEDDKSALDTFRKAHRLGSTEATPPSPPAPATVTVAPSYVVSGDWNSSEGAMTLEQDGDTLRGTYTQDSGRIRASRLSGSWEGIWSEGKSDRRCEEEKLGSYYWGRITILFIDENRHFEAAWSYCGDDTSGGKRWTGDRIK